MSATGREPENLDERRKRIGLADASTEERVRWFWDAVRPHTDIHQAYAWGKYSFGDDVKNWIDAFEILDDQRRKRAYHRLIHVLLSDYDIERALLVAGKLRALGASEDWWVRWRHFVLWRLLAGTIGGSLALGGSSKWLAMAAEFAKLDWWLVLTGACFLVLAPAPAMEYLQAPVHVIHRPGKWRRWQFVWKNALAFTFFVGVVQFVYYQSLQPSEWSVAGAADARYHVITASLSSFLGYVVNLIWRERPVFGP